MTKKIIYCGRGFLWRIKHTKPMKDIIKTKKNNKIVIKEEIVKPEDVLVLIDGPKINGIVPKNIAGEYYKYKDKLNFKSVYSIKGIIIHANNVKEAIEQYKEIKSNLLED